MSKYALNNSFHNGADNDIIEALSLNRLPFRLSEEAERSQIQTWYQRQLQDACNGKPVPFPSYERLDWIRECQFMLHDFQQARVENPSAFDDTIRLWPDREVLTKADQDLLIENANIISENIFASPSEQARLYGLAEREQIDANFGTGIAEIVVEFVKSAGMVPIFGSEIGIMYQNVKGCPADNYTIITFDDRSPEVRLIIGASPENLERVRQDAALLLPKCWEIFERLYCDTVTTGKFGKYPMQLAIGTRAYSLQRVDEGGWIVEGDGDGQPWGDGKLTALAWEPANLSCSQASPAFDPQPDPALDDADDIDDLESQSLSGHFRLGQQDSLPPRITDIKTMFPDAFEIYISAQWRLPEWPSSTLRI